ncbi:hypothetical protein ACROYT_G041643 [Oculina patagonica]
MSRKRKPDIVHPCLTPFIFKRKLQDEEEEEFYSLVPFPVGSVVRFYPLLVTGFTCARIELYGFPGPKVTCAPQYIIVEFKKSYYTDLEAPEMHLINTSCLAESDSDTHITFHIPFRGCGTVRIQTNDYLEYRNEIIRHITKGTVTYKMDLNFPITCKYDSNVTLNDVNFEAVEGETTDGPAVAGARLHPLHCWLVTLWLSGAVLYWVSVAKRGQFC